MPVRWLSDPQVPEAAVCVCKRVSWSHTYCRVPVGACAHVCKSCPHTRVYTAAHAHVCLCACVTPSVRVSCVPPMLASWSCLGLALSPHRGPTGDPSPWTWGLFSLPGPTTFLVPAVCSCRTPRSPKPHAATSSLSWGLLGPPGDKGPRPRRRAPVQQSRWGRGAQGCARSGQWTATAWPPGTGLRVLKTTLSWALGRREPRFSGSGG